MCRVYPVRRVLIGHATANKSVYVHSTGGTLLISWSAGGLSSSAQLTGITTNGTDICLVD